MVVNCFWWASRRLSWRRRGSILSASRSYRFSRLSRAILAGKVQVRSVHNPKESCEPTLRKIELLNGKFRAAKHRLICYVRPMIFSPLNIELSTEGFSGRTALTAFVVEKSARLFRHAHPQV